jgi:phosphate acetyltransferase
MNMAPNTEWIENVTYDELSVGQSARLLRTLTQADIQDWRHAHRDRDRG